MTSVRHIARFAKTWKIAVLLAVSLAAHAHPLIAQCVDDAVSCSSGCTSANCCGCCGAGLWDREHMLGEWILNASLPMHTGLPPRVPSDFRLLISLPTAEASMRKSVTVSSTYKATTKIVAGVFLAEDAEPLIERWVGTDVKDSPRVQQEIQDFFAKHGVNSVAATGDNMGCPHEEDEDFLVGEDCPFCPYWKCKQGSNSLF